MSQNAANFSVGTDNAIARYDTTAGAVLQNSVPTIDDIGNLSISAAVSGASLSATVANTSNTASATAFYNAQVAGSTAADAYYKVEISGGQAYTLGLDNSDSDAFVLSASATPGTTNVMRVASSGEINYPLQPAFLAYLATTDTNATGDNTVYTLGGVTALTEVFDQNGDFNTNGTFTAPVTGKYHLEVHWYVTGATAVLSGVMNIITSNRTFRMDGNGNSNAAAFFNEHTIFCDMDAADTATFTLTISDSGGKVDDIIGSNASTLCCGYLVC